MSAYEQITDPVAYHAEGPVWSEQWGGLRWVDMLAGDILTLRGDGTIDRMHVGTVAAFVRPRRSGGYVVGLEHGIGLSDDVNAPPVALPPMWSDPGIRMNEGGCDAAGNLYAGSMPYDVTPGAASLYRIAPDGLVETVLGSVTISNGIDFSPDGSLAYYNDSQTRRTDVFDVIDGRLTNRRPFHDGNGGTPDGLCVDSEGNVWVALNSMGAVRLYSPSAQVMAEIELPVRLVTACTLGGADGRDLYVTTSRENLENPEPEAGAVFRLRADVAGKAVLAYAG
ncbi:SMP-30/gluconolactonase/LRE family protein [Leifsonia sp. Root112D2]|uniref:SMP-30/gluconolactonase/LRE family protein n=1 Tax=Leifsonia sp. Root112D2 TaxID=1736426 RepID=UPI0006FA882D|nr:SMP-30/gluconolactonase/LRE family protein [Leifsonia sp. Root112D2]KQV08017.1 gluconolactonase [Leifsonia sp. Root112D2]